MRCVTLGIMTSFSVSPRSSENGSLIASRVVTTAGGKTVVGCIVTPMGGGWTLIYAFSQGSVRSSSRRPKEKAPSVAG